MEIIEQSVDVWGEVPLDINPTLQWVEKAGRVCYNSEDKIKPGSAKKFVENITKSGHLSVLEHSNLVLKSKYTFRDPEFEKRIVKGMIQSNFIFTGIQHDYVYIYGNWRAFIEEHRDVNFFNLPFSIERFFPGYEVVIELEDVPFFAQAATVCFVTARAVSHEIVRHRAKTAFSQRSQRYCSESNLKVIKPYWYDAAELYVQYGFEDSCGNAETVYRFLRRDGLSAQSARVVLPNCTATVLVMTAYLSEWEWIFSLRISSAAYPGIYHLMKETKQKMIKEDVLIRRRFKNEMEQEIS